MQTKKTTDLERARIMAWPLRFGFVLLAVLPGGTNMKIDYFVGFSVQVNLHGAKAKQEDKRNKRRDEGIENTIYNGR